MDESEADAPGAAAAAPEAATGTAADPPAPAPAPAPAPPAPPAGALPAPDAEAAAAAQLAGIYRGLPGVVPALIGGATLAAVQASLTAAQAEYAALRTALLREQAAGIPPAHAGPGAAPAPADPFELIRAGVRGLSGE
jgi:hypothetical protein